MSELKGKIDFTLFVSADNANPNGDPLNGNRPRINMDGHGEISDVCIKRKIRNRLQDLGQKIFVQSDDRTDDLYTSLKDRADGCEELKTQIGNKKNANRDDCAAIACKEWLDVRAFGQVFAFKGIPVSFGVRGPVSIHQAISLSPIGCMHLALGWVCSCTPVNRNPLHITLIWILVGCSCTDHSKFIELIRIELNCLVQSLYYALFYIRDVCIRCVSRSWICNFRTTFLR